MSKEFDKLKQDAKDNEARIQARKQERYRYARSLGFSAELARRLQRSGKERIDRLAKEL